MASEFNSCAHLVNQNDLNAAEELYYETLSAGGDPFQVLLEMQNSLQETLTEKFPHRVKAPRKIETKGELYQFILNQKIAIDDEWREMVDAIAGTEKPEKDRSAIWKRWKAIHDDISNESVQSLSQNEKLELMFEAIDICHFWNNVILALGLDAKAVFVMYFLKNAENFKRQERNY